MGYLSKYLRSSYSEQAKRTDHNYIYLGLLAEYATIAEKGKQPKHHEKLQCKPEKTQFQHTNEIIFYKPWYYITTSKPKCHQKGEEIPKGGNSPKHRLLIRKILAFAWELLPPYMKKNPQYHY